MADSKKNDKIEVLLKNKQQEINKLIESKNVEINKLKKEIEVLKECKEYVTEKCLDNFRLWKLDRMSQEDESEE